MMLIRYRRLREVLWGVGGNYVELGEILFLISLWFDREDIFEIS